MEPVGDTERVIRHEHAEKSNDGETQRSAHLINQHREDGPEEASAPNPDSIPLQPVNGGYPAENGNGKGKKTKKPKIPGGISKKQGTGFEGTASSVPLCGGLDPAFAKLDQNTIATPR
jgi:hypothetical protein